MELSLSVNCRLPAMSGCQCRDRHSLSEMSGFGLKVNWSDSHSEVMDLIESEQSSNAARG